MRITVDFKDREYKVNVSLSDGSENIGTTFKETQTISVADYYEGSYEFTPSSEAQTIPIIGKTATENIVINPVPSNYGLITWDGSSLMVS